jgi:hypothetical protein
MKGDIRIPMNFPTKTLWSYSVMANAESETEQIIPSVVHVIQFGDSVTCNRVCVDNRFENKLFDDAIPDIVGSTATDCRLHHVDFDADNPILRLLSVVLT